MNTPLLTIIVPVFNQETYIGRCLRSLLNQTIPSDTYEIIAINDASTDRTAYALELFKEDVTILNNEKNLGLPASLNRGIRKARSPYVVRVDSDDYVNKNFLLFLQAFLISNKYMDAIACDYFLVNDQEEVIERKNCLEEPIACGILFRIEQLLDIGLYDETFLIHEERELRERFCSKYSIHRLELPLYRYRRHDRNLTNDQDRSAFHLARLIDKHGATGNNK